MWLSDRDARESSEGLIQHDPMVHGATSFGEVFDAAVGQVFDEELSISSALNNEGWEKRRQQVRDLVAEGFDVTPYQDQTGLIDYDRIANETGHGVLTDRELYEQRTTLLAQRRAYSTDVIERGSGMAQFLGSMTGYMLDPVNVATLPLGASASALRGLSTLGRAATVARTEAAIAAATELAIQPLVYAHKNEIGSPYEVQDALAAIATAAIGAGALGGAASGIAGYVRRAANINVPDSPGVRGSREILEKTARTIESNPERMVQVDELRGHAKRFMAMDKEKLSAEIAAMRAADVDGDAVALEAAEAVMASRKGRWGANIEAERMAAEKGIEPEDFPPSLKEELGKVEHKKLVEVDRAYMEKVESERAVQRDQLGRPGEYDFDPDQKTVEFDTMEAEDLAKYEARGEEGVILADGEPVSARAFIDERTAEIDGLEEVRVCAYG